MNANYSAPDVQFSVGGVMGRTFSTIFKNPLLFFGLSAIPFTLLAASFLMSYIPSLADTIISRVLSIPFSLLGIFAQGAIAHATFESFMGNRVTIGSAASRAASCTGRLILITIVISIGTAFSALLLVIPCIMLTCMWSVAIPSCIVEGLGVKDSLGRSRSLTKGHRWKVFALLTLAGSLLVIMLMLAIGVSILVSYLPTSISTIITFVVLLAVLSFANTMMHVMVSVLYCSLRSVKEGLVAADLANVFN